MSMAVSFITARTHTCSFRKPGSLYRTDSTAGENQVRLPKGFCLGLGVMKLFQAVVSIVPKLGLLGIFLT